MKAPHDTTLDLVDGDATASERNSAALYLILRCDRPLEGALRIRLDVPDTLVLGRGTQRGLHEGTSGDAARTARFHLADSWVSKDHARLAYQLGAWTLEDLGSKNRTFVNGQPVERATLADGDLIEIGQTIFLFRRDAGPAGPRVLDTARLSPPMAELATFVSSLQQCFERLAQLAMSGVTILIHGETGTGKEVVARCLHQLSKRAGSFTAINCGALPTQLIAAELFGHRKGAFSGAHEDRPGLVRAANGGTLFLDEIGELPLDAQTALLRVLQEQEVLAIGSTRPTRVDLRVAIATHRNLDELVARGEFREDLLARLAGFTVRLPPLRERREDLSLLIPELLRRVAPEPDRVSFTRPAARALLLHAWPHNVRELERCLAAAVALAVNRPVSLDDLTEAVAHAGGAPAPPAPAPPAPARSPAPLRDEERAQRDELLQVLEAQAGNVNAVARFLKKDPKQIRRWLERYQIVPANFRGVIGDPPT